MARITKAAIESAKLPATGQAFLWDSSVKGFGVRLTPNGSATFIVQFRVGQKSVRKKLGRFGLMTPDEARQAARDQIVAASRRTTADDIADRRAGLTLAQIWGRYEAAGFPKARSGHKAKTTIAADRRRWIKWIQPKIGHVRIDQLRDSDIEDCANAARNEGSHGQAEQIAALVKAIMSYARRRKLTDNLAGTAIQVQPSKRVSNPLNADERRRLLEALRQMQGEDAWHWSASALELLLRTGMRLGEGLGVRREWINLETRSIKLPSAKADQQRGRVVHLSRDAVDVVERTIAVVGNPHLFPGRVEGAPLTNINKAWSEAKGRAGLLVSADGKPRQVRIHDLRHTFGTTAAAQGTAPHALQALMGHRNSTTTQRYVSLADETLKNALDGIQL